MRWHVKAFLFLGAALVLAMCLWLSFPAEPRYDGESLGRVLDRLYYDPPSEGSFSQAEARRITLTNVVRSVGTNALPFYLRRLQYKPGWYDKLDDWLRDKSSERLHLPERQNPNVQAMTCIQILGPDAAPAIPALEKMLSDEETSPLATRSLAAIGPAAVPALTNALIMTSSDRVRWDALLALGDLGPRAKPAAPLLLGFVENTNSTVGLSASDLALRALAEIDVGSSALKPLLIQCLTDTNTAPGAAFGLARIGPDGLPLLLQAVTNAEPKIRAAAEAALQIAQIRSAHPELSFDQFTSIFGLRLMSTGRLSESTREYQTMKPILLFFTADDHDAIRDAATKSLEFLREKSISETKAAGQSNSAGIVNP